MKSIFSVVLVFILSNFNSVYCQYANLEFTENKGQWNEEVKFKGEMNNGAFFLKEKGFRVLVNKPQDIENLSNYYHGMPAVSDSGNPTTASRAVSAKVLQHPPANKPGVTVNSHAYDVQFANAGNPLIVPTKPLNTFNNYFIGNNPALWKKNCSVYQAITYKNMYPGIDINYYTNEGTLKYDIIIHPNANITPLLMNFKGVDGLEVINEQLVIKTSVGEVRELAPYAYQIINGARKTIGCKFKVTGNEVRFVLDNYSPASTFSYRPFSYIFYIFRKFCQ